ncbi:hypothetical protein ACRRTK_005076 [Alexandromys fortis]
MSILLWREIGPCEELVLCGFTGFVCGYSEVGITVNTRAIFSVNVFQNGSVRKLPFKAFFPRVSEYTVKVKQVIVQTLHEDCELVSFKLVTGAEIATYCKLPEAERDGESGRRNFGFHMKIIDGYSGGSSSVYKGLGKPGSSDGVGSFHPSFSSAGSSLIPRLWL